MADISETPAAFDDDDLMPTSETRAATPPRDEVGRFTSPDPKPEVKPQHDPYMLARARQMDIPNAAEMSPAELSRMLTYADRIAAQTVKAAVKPEPEPEEPINWGKKPDGTPYTEETLLAEGGPLWVDMKRETHAARQDAKKAAAETKRLAESHAREAQERNDRQVIRQINKVLAGRPDLFGDKPGSASPGSVEAERYDHVIAKLQRLVQAKQTTTLEADLAKAIEIFGPPAGGADGTPPSRATKAPAAPQRPAARTPPTVADYDAASLARTTQRRSFDELTPREKAIRVEEEKARENGRPFAAYTGTPDDDDLPD